MVKVQQIPSPTPQPSNSWQPLAILNEDLTTLKARYGFAYEEGHDNLGRYRFAAIQLSARDPAWIAKHDMDANPGSVVFIGARADVVHCLEASLEALGLQRAELLWAAD